MSDRLPCHACLGTGLGTPTVAQILVPVSLSRACRACRGTGNAGSTYWAQTYGDGFFDYQHMGPEQIDPAAICHSLARIARFNGHAKPEFYSVAEHTLLVHHHAAEAGLGWEGERWAALHDAAEAYIGDMVGPLKALPEMLPFRDLEARVETVIRQRFGMVPTSESTRRDLFGRFEAPKLEEPTPEIRAAIRLIDLRVLAAEARAMLDWPPPRPWAFLLEIEPLPCEFKFWNPGHAEVALSRAFASCGLV